MLPAGLGQLVERLARGLDIRPSHVVTRVEYDRDGVKVVTDKAVFSADYAVITLPLRFDELSDRSGAPVWDYSGSPISTRRENFYNSQHLNADGAMNFLHGSRRKPCRRPRSWSGCSPILRQREALGRVLYILRLKNFQYNIALTVQCGVHQMSRAWPSLLSG